MRRLEAVGFRIERMRIEDVENFWAIRGGEGPCCASPAIPTWSRPARCRPGSTSPSTPRSTSTACCAAAAPRT